MACFSKSAQLLILILVFLTTNGLKAQIIDCSRTAVLSDGQYELSGTAYLERNDDGSIKLRLGLDFLTESGPDVQIFLSNDSTSISGGVMLEDIGTDDGIRHFSGALSIDVPSDVTMATYNFVVLRCITFQAFWGGGRLGAPTCDDPGSGGNGGGMMDTTMTMLPCTESIVATTGWLSSVSVCPNDGIDDEIPLINNLGLTAGDNFAYVFVDDNNNIRFIHYEDSYNFEGTSLATEYIFGVSYAGTLSYTEGMPLSSLTADTCAIVSNPSIFLTVTKENCGETFDCVLTNTATTNWVDNVSICPDDGNDDIIPFINNMGLLPGDHFAYLITDNQDILVDVVTNSSSYNFEGSGTSTNRVYAVSFDENLDFTIGEPISAITADGCIMLSSPDLFLTVAKLGCGDVASYSISGQVLNSKSVGLQGVDILNGDGDVLATTDAQGDYVINDLMEGTVVTVSVKENSSITNGVSSTDLVLIARHILSIAPFPSPYQVVAADANGNGTVSASDIVLLKRIILGLVEDVSTLNSWKFIDANQQLDMITSLSEIKEQIEVTIGKENVEEVNFIGVKLGDVNLNANTDLD